MGHLVCSSCLAKLPSTKKCCLCSRKGDYNRCYAMEKVLGSMQVPCSNAKYGCTAKTSYHQRQGHEAACPVGLCYCPGSGCGFSERSTGALLAHFVTAHGCPSTKFSYGVYFDITVGAREHVLVGDDEHLCSPWRHWSRLVAAPSRCSACGLATPSPGSGVACPSAPGRTRASTRSLRRSKCRAPRLLMMGYHGGTAPCSSCRNFI